MAGGAFVPRLAVWLRTNGVSCHAFARRLGISTQTVQAWAAGRRLPDIVRAFAIERETVGSVPVEAWLEGPLAEELKKPTRDWDAVAKHQKAYKARVASKQDLDPNV